MSFEAGDCYAGIQGLLMNRPVAETVVLEAIRKATLELTEDYKHPLLEVTGPLTNLVAYQNSYAPSFFLQTADAPLDVSKVNSFFIYNDPYVVPSNTNSETNAGYDLKFRSFDSIEVLLNIPGLPLYWSRNNNQILIGSMPDNTYVTYMRYQKQHPSSQTPNGFVATTSILMADSWQEILEYATALRLAPQLNLANKKAELHTALYGDQKFQTSGGIEGAPGLVFQRTSQRNRDQGTTTRRLRLRMGSV
jgi:hypothetical protein